MPQRPPCLRTGNAIHDKAVLILEGFYRALGASAEMTVGFHWTIQILVAEVAQLILKRSHRIAFCIVAKCGIVG